jgi:hypothetical protein
LRLELLDRDDIEHEEDEEVDVFEQGADLWHLQSVRERELVLCQEE